VFWFGGRGEHEENQELVLSQAVTVHFGSGRRVFEFFFQEVPGVNRGHDSKYTD